MFIKIFLRKLLIFFHLDLTKNLQYDRLTRVIMKRNIKQNTNCIDIGSHRGEILDLMLTYAPRGKHFAFEPIPELYEALKKKFAEKALVFPYALSDTEGLATFQFVKNAPAYSGLKKRKYVVSCPNIEEIEVEVKTLDKVIPLDVEIGFIKIDVEGAEFSVLKGAKELLIRNKPTILFECGKGASDYYGTDPLDVFDFITKEVSLKIFTLSSFIKSKIPLDRTAFGACYSTNREYYFVAQ